MPAPAAFRARFVVYALAALSTVSYVYEARWAATTAEQAVPSAPAGDPAALTSSRRTAS